MKLKAIVLFIILAAFSSGKAQFPLSIGTTVPALGKNIECIFQDRNNNYWFASNGDGVYRYDGKNLTRITESDGICSNFVRNIQEDANGTLWFATRDGICSFDGMFFKNYTDTIKNAAFGKLHYQKGGIFFEHSDAICYYDGKNFTNFTIYPDTYTPAKNNAYRPYAVYCAVADGAGNVWFGTQDKGVCRYDGEAFSYVTGKDLDGPAVRAIFSDKKGGMWFGNNGGGLFRYDGKNLRNITEENGLGNTEFLKGKFIDKPGSLARVWAINDDADGNIWIGTIDAGVWKYDGSNLTNYTAADGLAGNSIWVIYKDKKGELWFVTNGDAVCRFDGKRFVRVGF